MKKITFLISMLTASFCFSQAPQLAYDIYPGQNSSVPANPVLFNGSMYFSAYFSGFGSELTRFDGTNTPIRVADIYPGFNSSSFEPDPIVFNDKIYFTATNGTNGYELWNYDGINPPAMVMDIRPGSANSFPEKFTVFNNKLYFYANDGSNGGEIWQYDGTNPPTMLLDLFVGSSSSLASHFCQYNGKLYFSAKDSSAAAKIWEYDGVQAPTQVFTDLLAPSYLYVYNEKMYLRSYNTSLSAVQFLNFDGLSLHTEPNITGPILAVLNGTVYFSNESTVATTGYELWKYDGVSAPTIAADINPGAASSNPSSVTVYNNKLYFVANDGTHGYEVWSYNGNTAVLTGEITPTVIDPNITFMIVYNGKLYLNANNGAAVGQNGAELWMIDAPLAVNALEKNTAVLYPNPTDGLLNLSSPTEFDEIDVYDLNGRNLAHLNFAPANETQILLDITSGCYWMTLLRAGKTVSRNKVIVN